MAITSRLWGLRVLLAVPVAWVAWGATLLAPDAGAAESHWSGDVEVTTDTTIAAGDVLVIDAGAVVTVRATASLLLIDAGAELRVEEGAQFLIASREECVTASATEHEASCFRIEARGLLAVEGQPGRPVSFSAIGDTVGGWGGIGVSGAVASCEVAYAEIRDAKVGIVADGLIDGINPRCTVHDGVFAANQIHAALANDQSHLWLYDNHFTNHPVDAGGWHGSVVKLAEDADGRIENNVFAGNGEAAVVIDNASPLVINNTIVTSGIGIAISSDRAAPGVAPEIRNNIVLRDGSEPGWAIDCEDRCSVLDCRPAPLVAYNNAYDPVSGALLGHGDSAWTPCSFLDQTAYEAAFNISADPLFASPARGDYRLLLGPVASPSIDAGDPDPYYNDVSFPPSLGWATNDQGAYGGPRAALMALPVPLTGAWAALLLAAGVGVTRPRRRQAPPASGSSAAKRRRTASSSATRRS
ncbi:MAG: right-handed parallel beta-helix repeat-containing protein [Candidatus Schekmanbacteria bacterium]|nr:right-handed parallel beta-helix repeat-containing protein [Candidatus Schekmanbacteria bacterium]